MTKTMRSDGWTDYLLAIDRPMVHIGPTGSMDEAALREAAGRLRFAVFELDFRLAQTESDVVDTFGRGLQFPAHFGRNWDAVLDCLQDLSWASAPGYVLILRNMAATERLQDRSIESLVAVLEAAIREWRDERGEYTERTSATPFHVFLLDSRPGSRITTLFKEPLCLHVSSGACEFVTAPDRIRSMAEFSEAGRLISDGGSAGDVVNFLFGRGIDVLTARYLVGALLGVSMVDAKQLVDDSELWARHMQLTSTIGQLIFLARRRVEEGQSAESLLRTSGYFDLHEAVTASLIEQVLRSHPYCVADWQRFSNDKRTSVGPYFRSVTAGFEVGGVPSGETRTFDDAIAACATYIKSVVEDIRLSSSRSSELPT